MSVQSRRAVREEIGAVLTSALAGLTQRIYTDQPLSFGGESPVVVVASDGSEREGTNKRTFGGPIAPTFHLDIYTFVLSATTNGDDALDDLEQGIAQIVSDNPGSGSWTAISYGGRTETAFITVVDGTEYKRERIPLTITGKGA